MPSRREMFRHVVFSFAAHAALQHPNAFPQRNMLLHPSLQSTCLAMHTPFLLCSADSRSVQKCLIW